MNQKLFFNFHPKDIKIVRIQANDKSLNGMLGLIVYGFTLVNSSSSQIKIKKVEFEYELDKKNYSNTSMSIRTNSVYSPAEEKTVPSIALKDGKGDRLVLMNWLDFGNRILRRRQLKAGEMLHGCVFFPLKIKDTVLLKSIQNPAIIVIDKNNVKSKNPISISSEAQQHVPILELR